MRTYRPLTLKSLKPNKSLHQVMPLGRLNSTNKNSRFQSPRQLEQTETQKKHMLKAFKHNCPLTYSFMYNIKQIDSLYPFIPRHPVIPPQKVF